jgi:phosphatidylglycerophosphate synthase/phosphatidylglycerophosphatase A
VILAAGFFAVLWKWRFDHSPLSQTGDLWRPDWVLLTAMVLFILAAVTDAVDGYLARKWRAITTFGRIMDPFADKLLIIGGFVYLAGPGFEEARYKEASDTWVAASVTAVQAWMVVVILARELLVTSIRAVFEGQGVKFPSTLSGKLKMILQSVAIPAILLLLNVPHVWVAGQPNWAGRTIQWLVWITVAVTVWSGVPYISRAMEAARGTATDVAAGARKGLSGIGELLITTFGLGYMRPAPGTWGSLPTVALAAILIAAGVAPGPNGLAFNAVLIGVAIAGTVVCVMFGDGAEARFFKKDPSQVVMDETAGQAVALLFLPATAVTTPWRTAVTLAVAFFAFRIFDIIKPPPARQIQAARGGWGIVLDDLIAGVFAAIVVQIVTRILM